LHDFSLEFFGPNHRNEEVGEQQQGDDADDDCFHEVLLESVAESHVNSANNEECDHSADKN
jgi:hypothetical protein